jgi:DNA-binding SARP family transcriptional activator
VPSRADLSLRLHAGGDEARPDGRRPPVRLEMLGGFSLLVDGLPASQPPQAQRLLAFLALHRRPLQRAFVSGRLWPRLTQEHAFGCLRTTLWRIGDRDGLLETTCRSLGLTPRVAIDAAELEDCAEEILVRGKIPDSPVLHRLVHAADLLPDWYDDWVVEERERLAQLRMLALESTADELIGAGSYREAALVVNAAVHADPLRESTTRLLIRLHLAMGNPGQAVREYRAFRTRLARDLALDPSPETTALVRSLA